MDWARDQLGNLVHASQRGLFSYGLTCPTCGQLVRRRAGAERRPHFAHYSHSAKPECENYHPSLHVTTPGVQRFKESTSGQPPCQGGIFWERNERGGYSLYVKLPQLPEGTSGLGEIEIQSGLGVRLYKAFQLKRPRLVPVIPELPLVEVKAFGELAVVGAAIRLLAERFRCSDNYFMASGASGRLLAPEEPLEWGERYWLLTQYPLGPIPVGFGLKVEPEVPQRGWYAYEVALPTLSETGSDSEREALSRYLGRSIRPPRARVYFIDPPPHHIRPDGTHVFPETTERILLRRTEPNNISLEGSPTAVSCAFVNDLADEWVEIRGIRAGDFTVLLDGGEELLGRVEECELFQPRGVRVALGDSTWDIFEPELREVIRQDFGDCLRIECPSLRVADNLALTQELWFREGASYILCRNKCQNVDAGNFGVLAWPVPELSGSVVDAVAPQAIAKRIWLEGLVARLYGPDVVWRLRKQWDKTLPMNLSSELAWLRPHIVSAQSS